jgi:hypothetical protein
MKIRHGFVSNSSSSSFLIKSKEIDRTALLTDSEIELLKANKFEPTNIASVSYLFYNNNNKSFAKDTDNNMSFGMRVSENQDIIIAFLLKNNISFSGLCVNGTEWLFYQKNSTVMTKIKDFGKYMEIYGHLPYATTPHISYIDVQTFLIHNPYEDGEVEAICEKIPEVKVKRMKRKK